MKEKICINANRDKILDFETSLESVQDAGNELITIFENFQPYKKIKTLKDFERLVKDPLSEFDEALQTNVSFQESGGKKGNPAVIASLFDIERENYIAIITGQKITGGSCKPCSKLKITTGKGVLNYTTYHNYQDYLIFNEENRFIINESAVTLKKESFKIYAESPEAIEVYNFWVNLCDTLNELQTKGYCGDLMQFQTILKNRLMFSYHNHLLSVNEEMLYQEIANLKIK